MIINLKHKLGVYTSVWLDGKRVLDVIEVDTETKQIKKLKRTSVCNSRPNYADNHDGFLVVQKIADPNFVIKYDRSIKPDIAMQYNITSSDLLEENPSDQVVSRLGS